MIHKKNKGITLVALVVTIIVLLILAAVSFNLILGENGVITRAKQAKEKTIKAQEYEMTALLDLEDYIEENTIKNDIWAVQKNTNYYAGYVELKIKSKYLKVNALTLEEYKEAYLVKGINNDSYVISQGRHYDTMDDVILDYYDKNLLPTIEDYITYWNLDMTRTEAIEDYWGDSLDDYLMSYDYTQDDITRIEQEYENEYLPEIEKYNDLSQKIKNKNYTITYPDGTEETVSGADLYKFEREYRVKENGTNNIVITEENKKTITISFEIDNLIKRVDDEYYKYVPVRGGYNAIVLDRTLTTYPVPSVEVNGVPVIGLMKTFYYCQKLTDINFTDFDSSKIISMYSTFSACNLLTSLDLSSFDTSNVLNMKCMFGTSKKLSSINLGNFDTSKVTNMSEMFLNCDMISTIDVTGFNTSNVTDMSRMFENCGQLTNLDVSGFNTSKVTRMDRMFNMCQKLTYIDVSGFDTSKVTRMDKMFSITEVTNLDVTNFDTSNVTNMEYMFDGFKGTSLDISNFDTSKVTSMDSMFSTCIRLTNLDLSNFDTSKVNNMFRMFYNCSALTTVNTGDKWIIGDETNTTDMFTNCGISTL